MTFVVNCGIGSQVISFFFLVALTDDVILPLLGRITKCLYTTFFLKKEQNDNWII